MAATKKGALALVSVLVKLRRNTGVHLTTARPCDVAWILIGVRWTQMEVILVEDWSIYSG